VISAGNPSESTSLPAATNDSPEENKKDLASTMRR
jgi:hypothetical protein